MGQWGVSGPAWLLLLSVFLLVKLTHIIFPIFARIKIQEVKSPQWHTNSKKCEKGFQPFPTGGGDNMICYESKRFKLFTYFFSLLLRKLNPIFLQLFIYFSTF